MLVSGIPTKNGNNHAGAVVSMSLDILSCIAMFRTGDMPEDRLQLRIGLHSGMSSLVSFHTDLLSHGSSLIDTNVKATLA